MMKRVSALASVALLLSIAVVRSEEPLNARDVLAALNPACMGCGPDAYSKGKDVPHPMAFALLASTGKLLNDQKLTEDSANWLVESSAKLKNHGWGLGFAWDAFNDGSINPPDTIYGITTALAVAGLLDAYELTGKKPYLDTAASALDHYAASFSKTDSGGYFWYSDQPSDDISVFNVTSMLMGQYARAAKILDRTDFKGLADLAATHLHAHIEYVDGVPYWPYSDRNPQPNDAVHAAYVVQGLVDYYKQEGDLGDFDGHARYLRSFRKDIDAFEFSRLQKVAPELQDRSARLWGIGMMIYTLTEIADDAGAQEYIDTLRLYRAAKNALHTTPGSTATGEPRMTAHVAVGLARANQSE